MMHKKAAAIRAGVREALDTLKKGGNPLSKSNRSEIESAIQNTLDDENDRAENRNQERIEKTTRLMVLVNLMVAPLYLFDVRLGLRFSLVLNLVTLEGLHELGRKKRPTANAINSVSSFFGSRAGLECAVENVIHGGELIYDEYDSIIKKY